MKISIFTVFYILIQSCIGINVYASNHNNKIDTIQPVGKAGTADTLLFAQVEKEAEYPGGGSAWKSFLQAEIDQDVPFRKGAPVGTYVVFVQFIIMPDGKVGYVKGLSKNGFGMEEEVVRVIKKSKTWSPAVQNGRTVRAYRKQPMTFTVFEDTSNKRKKNYLFGR